jgi:transcriptional regulator with XRE-family HTH domain
MSDERLDQFRKLNKNKEKLPWKERAKIIKKTFPSIEQLDWNQLMSKDINIMGNILRDVWKADVADPNQVGPRTTPSAKEGLAWYKKISGQDFSLLDFCSSFRELAGDRSIRHLTTKTGLKRDYIHRILHGRVDPTMETIEKVAKSFGKDPSFFREYREMYILSTLQSQLAKYPDSSMGIYLKMRTKYGSKSGSD